MEWISVKERLPVNIKKVLCIDAKGHQYVAFYTTGGNIEYYNTDDEPDYLQAGWYEEEEQVKSDYDYHFCERIPTYWMILPNKPNPQP
jgi:hypothetical protein